MGKVENFDGGIFWAGKFGKYFPLGAWLDSSRDFWAFGVSSVVRMATRCGKVTLNNMMISNVFIFCVISFNAFWKFLRLGNSPWDFLEG